MALLVVSFAFVLFVSFQVAILVEITKSSEKGEFFVCTITFSTTPYMGEKKFSKNVRSTSIGD